MGRRLLVAVLLAGCAICAENPRTIVRFGKLWDGANHILTPMDVEVSGGRITAIRKRGPVSAGATLVDLSRYTGLPGLIDVHVHIMYYWDRRLGPTPHKQRERSISVRVFLAQENARKTLETGVTTARDLNAGDAIYPFRELIELGAMAGPRLFVSGAGIGGGRKPLGAERIRQVVEQRVKAGCEWIKLFASTGGFQDVTGTQTLALDEMQAAVEAAHRFGKRVAIHSYGASGVRDAVQAGADSIEHGADLDEATLVEMARKRIFWVPTVDHNRYYIDARNEFQFAPGAEAGLRDYIERNLASVRRAHQLGVRLAMGSDAVFTMFGQNTRELEWFVKAGLTPEQALAAATAHGAELLGVEDRLGKLQAGFLADMIAVEGEPWKEIEAVTRRVRWVMKEGVVVVDRAGRR